MMNNVLKCIGFAVLGLLAASSTGCFHSSDSVTISSTHSDGSVHQFADGFKIVNIGDSITIDGTRRAFRGSTIREFELHDVTFHCEPADSVKFDTENMSAVFQVDGDVRIWLVEKALKDEEDPEFGEMTVRSNDLHFRVAPNK